MQYHVSSIATSPKASQEVSGLRFLMKGIK